MKHLKKILFIAPLVAYLVIVTSFISEREKMEKISALKIHITDSTRNQFIHTADVMALIERKKLNMFGKPAGSFNLEEIENTLLAKQIVRTAEVYITEPGVLHVDIRQKTPFMRISNRLGQGYYLDDLGNLIPLSQNFSPFVIVASGYITEPFSIGQTLNIFNIRHDSLSRAQKMIYDVYALALFISRDDFWKAQIEQIYVNNRFDIELIPRVGSQIIELGSVENLEEKFENLKLLYIEGFNKIGWNQYERINLKYKNQVVCTKIQ